MTISEPIGSRATISRTAIRRVRHLNNVLVSKHPTSGQVIPVKIPEVNITGIVQCYQSADTLARCLESLSGRVDRIVCIDGNFTMKNTPHYHPSKTRNGASDDASEKIAK